MDMVYIAIFYSFLCVMKMLQCYASNLLPVTPAPEFLPAPFNVSFHVGDLAKLRCGINNLGTKTTVESLADMDAVKSSHDSKPAAAETELVTDSRSPDMSFEDETVGIPVSCTESLLDISIRVVWRRFDSSFPLTSGKMTVIDDKRIQVSHVAHKNQWDLMIKDVKPDDDGVYECQISTKDRTVRRLVTLHVIEPKVEIPEINITEPQYVERGDPIVLQCNATGEHHPPEEMDWFRNGQKISSHTKKGIHISKQFSIQNRKFSSTLKIDRAEMEDDGTYVCRSSNMQITSTKVIVLNAETSPIKRATPVPLPVWTVGGKESEDKGSYTSKSTAARIPWTFLLNIASVLVILTFKAMALFPS